MARKSKAERLVEQVTGERWQDGGGVPAGFTARRYGPPLSHEGDVVIGTYQGPGKSRVMIDPDHPKVKRSVKVYKIKTDAGVVEVVAASQIEQFIEDGIKTGTRIFIRRRGQVETRKGRRVTEYDFGVEE